MQIEIAPHAGFCFGVKRSVDAVDALLSQGRSITTLGPVIHNPSVIASMVARGVTVADEMESVAGNTVVIRAHGAPERVHAYFREKGIAVVDTTCPLSSASIKRCVRLRKTACRS